MEALRQQLRQHRSDHYHEDDTSSDGDVDSNNIESSVSEGSVGSSDDDLNEEVEGVDIGNSAESHDEDQVEIPPPAEDENLVEMPPLADAIDARALPVTEDEKEDYLVDCLKYWGQSGGVISMRKLDELLHLLNPVWPKVPLTYVTLLQSSKNLGIIDMGDHLFWYHGVEKSLGEFDLEEYLAVFGHILLDIGSDGLQAFTSGSNTQRSKFWPILGRLVGASNPPFVIGIHFGKDPTDVDMFLGRFILEMQNLLTEGYYFDGRKYPVRLRNFICDAPARSLVKCCVGHGGYGACEKCTIVGTHAMGRRHFANIGPDVRLRTDQSYKNQEDRLHHTGRSPLELLGVGMVSQFRLDSMHLVYEGVCRRLLEVWTTWDGPWHMTNETMTRTCNKINILKETCPCDFNRKPRRLDEWARMKAKDLRRVLLYEGVVIFQLLEEALYQQYLLLHSAIFILANPFFLNLYADHAQQFIDEFVDHSKHVYGDHFVVYNVHSLKHMVDECRENGPIDSFGAFPYENELKRLLDTLMSGFRPLEQIARRRSEKKDPIQVEIEGQENKVELLHPHIDPAEREAGSHYSKIIVNSVTLKIGVTDSCFMTKEGAVFMLVNVLHQREDCVILVGEQFLNTDNCYTYPMDSSELGILKIWNLGDERVSIPLENVFCKCWVMRNGDHFVSIPINHSCPLLH